MPPVSRYVNRLQGDLRGRGVQAPLYIMKSNGGVISAQAVQRLLGLLSQLHWAIASTALLSLFVGLVLVLAIARDQAHARRWETNLLKVLGADLRAIRTSLVLAVAGATIGMVLASVTAYLTVRTKIAGRGLLEGLVFVPLAFPGTALAIGLLWGYVRFPVPIYATIWILLIAYVTRFLPFGLRAITSTMVQVHRELEESSRVCGGGLVTTFRRILLPLLRPGFMAGWAILATIFMREFSTSLFLYTPRSEPIGPLLYHLWIDGQHGRMAALGVVVSLTSVLLVAAAGRITRTPLAR